MSLIAGSNVVSLVAPDGPLRVSVVQALDGALPDDSRLDIWDSADQLLANSQTRPDLVIISAGRDQLERLFHQTRFRRVLLLLDTPVEPALESLVAGSAPDIVGLPLDPVILRVRVRAALMEISQRMEQALQRMMLEEIADAVIFIDQQFRVRFINHAARVLLGLTTKSDPYPIPLLADLYQIQWPEPEDEAVAFAYVHQHGSWQQEVEIVTRDGVRLRVDATIRVVRDDGGAVLGLLGTLRDITARAAVEQAEREQRRLADALRETAATLTRSLDPQSVMRQILVHVGRVVPHRAASIMLAENDLLRPAYMDGYTDDARAIMETQAFRISDPIFSQMITTGNATLLGDVLDSPDWRVLPHLEWIKSYIGTPIRAYEHVIGFLNLYADTHNAFSDDDALNLRAFADQAAIAIENAQLYDAIFRDVTEVRTLDRATSFLFTADLFRSSNLATVTAHIASAVVREFDTGDCGVFLIEPGTRLLTRQARVGDFQAFTPNPIDLDQPSIFQTVVEKARPIYIHDTHVDRRFTPTDPRTRSQLVLPLKSVSMGDVIGLLDLQSEDPDAFTAQDQRSLHAFSERVAALLENIRLYQSIQRRVDERTVEVNRVKEQVEAILNHTSDAVAMLLPEGQIQQVNAAFVTLIGLDSDAVFGHSMADYLPEAVRPEYQAALASVVAERRLQRFETLIIPPDPQLRTMVELSLSAIQQANKVTGVVVSLRDISDRTRMESELRATLGKERELNRLRSEFVRRASHTFRTPLSAILTSTELLTRFTGRLSDQQRQQQRDSLRISVQQLTRLLDDLLLINRTNDRVNTSDGQVYTMPELCQEIVDQLDRDGLAQNRLRWEVAEGIPPLTVDRGMLSQIVSNLLTNALKYSMDDATVRLMVTFTDTDLVITVEDQGIGIPADDLAHIYEPFYRGRNVEHVEGSGLGLTIVRDCLGIFGGEIGCESVVGSGTRFTVRLPLSG